MNSLIFVNQKKLPTMTTMLLRLIIVCFLIVCCKNPTNNDSIPSKPNSSSLLVTEQDISKLKFLEYGLDAKTETVLETWEQYKELNRIVSNVKGGNLLYFRDNKEVTSAFLKDLKEKIPDTMNTPSVAARLVALETKFLKLESLYNLSSSSKNEMLGIIKEFLESFSNLNLQMNKKLEKESQLIETPL